MRLPSLLLRPIKARDVNVITETGLYILVFKSRKPKAEEFTRWVAKEVLPTIRKTGRTKHSNRATAENRQLSAIDKANVGRARPL